MQQVHRKCPLTVASVLNQYKNILAESFSITEEEGREKCFGNPSISVM